MMLGGVFLINSQLFIPVSLHRGEQEGREGGMEGGREMQRGEGGREATAASMHRCSLLNVSISPSLLPPALPPSLSLHLTFLSVLQRKHAATRWRLS